MRLYEYRNYELTNSREAGRILTTDCCTSHVNGGELWVHLDSVLFSGDFGISIIDLFVDPSFEVFAGKGVDAVGDIGSWEFINFPLDDWERFHDSLRSCLCPVQHVFDRKALEKWDGDYFDICLLDHLPFSAADISDMKNCHALVWRQIDTCLRSKPPIYLVLGFVFSAESLSIDSYILLVVGDDGVDLLIRIFHIRYLKLNYRLIQILIEFKSDSD